jgi:hypothetical protein
MEIIGPTLNGLWGEVTLKVAKNLWSSVSISHLCIQRSRTGVTLHISSDPRGDPK